MPNSKGTCVTFPTLTLTNLLAALKPLSPGILLSYQHSHILQLLGTSLDWPHKCLVYVYKELGSLRANIDSTVVPQRLSCWRRRLTIIQQITAAAEYLQRLSRCDLLRHNILQYFPGTVRPRPFHVIDPE